MLQNTNGIVLRSVKYGETSLITTIFTAQHGVETYMVQGIRSTSSKQNRAGAFQPATLLELVVYQQPQKNMQRIREFRPAYIYQNIQEHVVKNTIVLFSVEIMVRLLPERAPLPQLFDFAFEYFVTLDKIAPKNAANFPLFFITRCSKILGYELKENYSKETPHLNLQEGGYTAHPPESVPFTTDEDAALLSKFLATEEYMELIQIEMNASVRMRLIDWYIIFLQQHTQHMGNIRSLPILRTILH